MNPSEMFKWAKAQEDIELRCIGISIMNTVSSVGSVSG